jgi:hypothetical protein
MGDLDGVGAIRKEKKSKWESSQTWLQGLASILVSVEIFLLN